VTDYYELIGVEPDAPKEEIRSAYRDRVERLKDPGTGKRAPSEAQLEANRDEIAELNRAWSILSDPVQRRRYDARLESGGADDDGADADGEAEERVPARRASTRTAPAVDARGRPRPEPTIVMPEGMRLAETRARNMALLFDVSILAVLFFVVQLLGQWVISERYPAQVDRIKHYNTQIDDANKAKDKAQGKVDDAKDALKKKGISATEKAKQQDIVKTQQAKVDAEKKTVDATQKKVDDETAKLQPVSFGLLGVAVVVSLLYCVPMSALTGQTLGKRTRRIKLVKLDGSPPGWGASFVHYLVPILLALAGMALLQGLGVLLGLGSVLWYLRDRNRQGFDDKLAKTLVVEA
jgi:curved DNA-binding protein CbpA